MRRYRGHENRRLHFGTINLPGGALLWNTANLSTTGEITYLEKALGSSIMVR